MCTATHNHSALLVPIITVPYFHRGRRDPLRLLPCANQASSFQNCCISEHRSNAASRLKAKKHFTCDVQSCSCDWLWPSRQALAPALATSVGESGGAARMPLILAAFADAAALLQHCSPAAGDYVQVLTAKRMTSSTDCTVFSILCQFGASSAAEHFQKTRDSDMQREISFNMKHARRDPL